MRFLTTFTALSGLALTAPAQAQSLSPQAGSNEPTVSYAQSTQKPAQKPTRVEVVELKDLPQSAQNQVNSIVETMPQEDVQKLRQSIDALPEAAEALKAKGINSSHVVVATVNDEGILVLITKSAT